jgi:NADPH:quinone reductase-like Zn-dependent oxidoreductase
MQCRGDQAGARTGSSTATTRCLGPRARSRAESRRHSPATVILRRTAGWALIHAAAGGVGSAKVMLAHALGAKTVFTASGQRIERVSELGGTVSVDYRKHDSLDAALDAIDRRGVWWWDHGDDDGQGSLHSDRP